MAAGSRRLDLYIEYQGNSYLIELKIRYGEQTYQEGIEKLADYMDKFSCQEGWLIVFDKRKHRAWEDKIFWRSSRVGEKRIHCFNNFSARSASELKLWTLSPFTFSPWLVHG